MPIEFVEVEQGRRVVVRQVTGTTLDSANDVYRAIGKIAGVDADFPWIEEAHKDDLEDERIRQLGNCEPLLIRVKESEDWTDEVKDAIKRVRTLMDRTTDAGFDVRLRIEKR